MATNDDTPTEDFRQATGRFFGYFSALSTTARNVWFGGVAGAAIFVIVVSSTITTSNNNVDAARERAEVAEDRAEAAESDLDRTRSDLSEAIAEAEGLAADVARLSAQAEAAGATISQLRASLAVASTFRAQFTDNGDEGYGVPEGVEVDLVAATATTREALLRVSDLKDGDSFIATDGNEYRLGLVNAPEANEACGTEATAFTRRFLADGFTVDAYTVDAYGRLVAEVHDSGGQSLNIALASSGLGNDKYLGTYRDENPDLARRLDTAFANASRPDCLGPEPTPTPTPAQAAPPTAPASNSTCHPDYITCIPIKGDGSGNGSANDLDCGDIGRKVQTRGSRDPYRLDRDGDGWGCESYG